MNEHMLTDHEIESMLQEAGTTFAPPKEFKTQLRRRLVPAASGAVATPASTSPRPILADWWRYFTQSRRRAWGLASLAAVCVAVIATALLWPTQLTMAQVQAAVAQQDWIHLKYDNGRERWISLQRGVHAFVSEEGRIVYSVPHEGVIQYYDQRLIPPEYKPSYISQRKTPPRAMEPTVWLATVGWEEDIADGSRKMANYEVERHVEVTDDRMLFRFDGWHTDAIGRRILIRQLWADPVARLPVKVCEKLNLAERNVQDREYITADYTFPNEGPESIFDLGIPDTLPVAQVEQSASSNEVEAILEAARAARNRFPENFRQVTWSQLDRPSHGEVDVYYWSGRTTERPWGDGHVVPDYSEVNIHWKRYFYFASLNDDDLLPANSEDVIAWTARQAVVSEYLSDREKTYFYHRPFRAENSKSQLRILRTGKILPYNQYSWILSYQWNPLQHPEPPFSMIPIGPDTPPGTIGMRREFFEQRQDYYLDPEHDFICVKHVLWNKRNGQWVISLINLLTDFIQLPEGQWIATRHERQDMGTPELGTSAYTSIWNIDITLLAPDEFPPGIFDGEKLLEEAKKLGATIETY